MIDVEKIIKQENKEEIQNRALMIQKQLEYTVEELLIKREMYYTERVEKILHSEIYDENSIKQLLYELFEHGRSAAIKQLYLKVCAFLERRNPRLAERYVCMLWLKFGFDEGEE